MPDPKMMTAISTFVSSTPGGAPTVIREGDRLRNDDPCVKRHSQYFLADGAASDEVRAAQSKLFARRMNA